MPDNPVTKAVSRPNRPTQTPAPAVSSKGKVVKQSKAKIEYRAPLSALDEKYLGACNNPFTKSQYEKLVRSPIMPPSFLSIRASEPKDGNVCLYASSVFGGVAVRGLIGKLNKSCTAVAGVGSKSSCGELIDDLKRRLPQKPAEQKTPSLHDPRALNPLSAEFWKDRWRGGWGGADFAIGMGAIAGAYWVIKKIIEKYGGGGSGGNKTGDPEDTSKPTPPDTGSKMVAAALVMLTALAKGLKDIKMPPAPPSVPSCPSGFCIVGEPLLDYGRPPNTYIRLAEPGSRGPDVDPWVVSDWIYNNALAPAAATLASVGKSLDKVSFSSPKKAFWSSVTILAAVGTLIAVAFPGDGPIGDGAFAGLTILAGSQIDDGGGSEN